MKYLQAEISLLLLITCKGYRKKWRETCDEPAEINNEVEASLRNDWRKKTEPKFYLARTYKNGGVLNFV
ncbi:MAG TPA: hypothetical protein VMV48_00950 [Gallionellaceae bacterium]|nr:hypothetical protein [Gallionellaceae bacterium]